MPRISSIGKHIFPAGEVAEFTVCPKAWHLKRVEQQPLLSGSDADYGEEQHSEWAKDVEYGFTLGRMLRILAALFSCATLLLLMVGPK